MRRETHERALLATAKIAAAAALLGSGCSNSAPVPDSPDPAPAETPAEVDETSDPAESPADTEEASVAPSDTPSPAPSDSAADKPGFGEMAFLKHCTKKVEAAVAAGEKQADADMKKCCQTIADDYDKRKASWMGNERYYCCSSLNWQGSMACTPWGPPMPPEMSWGLA